jgi:ABC-2 type transport system ATP-binding protein
MLIASGLTRRYETVLALDHVSFEIRPGEILGYLGPNGSGKSTTINMVVGLLEPTRGSLTLCGDSLTAHPEAYKRRIGYVPEEPHLYTHLTAFEYLQLVGRLRQAGRAWQVGKTEHSVNHKATELLRLFQLWDSRYNAMSSFSKGMRQRVLLAAALMHAPDLLVLDEPFSGLDVNASVLFRTLLRMFAHDGGMILFSSHRLDVVEQICSRVVILKSGRIVAEDEVSRLRQTLAAPSLEDVFARVTSQEDYSETAGAILDVARA